MNNALVKIWGRNVGALLWDEPHKLAYFEYDKAFVGGGLELSPLTMPLSRSRVYSFPALRKRPDEIDSAFNGLPGLVADALPDRYGNELIDAWLASRGRPAGSMNPVEKLCFIGKRAMGAMEFEPVVGWGGDESFTVEIDSLVNMAAKMMERRSAFSANIHSDEELAVRKILSIGTSAGGARPKAVIAMNDTTGEVLSGQCAVPEGFEHWLIKLDGVSSVQLGGSHGFGRVEYAYYLMAKDCGIRMMPCRLLEENGRAHFLTKRFDRKGNAERMHTQTLCAMSHMDFNNNRSYSYEQLFQVMRRLKLTYPEMEQMFRRMVFNVFARNCDDHTKNHTFIMQPDGTWQLAPAYDICHAYRPGSDWVSFHSLSVNGRRDGITIDDMLQVAKLINCRNPESVIEEVRHSVSHWMDFAEEAKVDVDMAKTIDDTLIK
jgi:serine/threonine-protein kinase HipA